MVIISGSNSFLASKLIPHLRNNFQVYAFDDEQGSINDYNFMLEMFSTVKPKYFINLKEKTDIIDSEFDRETCYNINSLSLKIISNLCKKNNVKLIQLSSGYVYSDKTEKMLTEDDDISAEFVYADSKLYSEKIIAESGVNALVLRAGDRFFENGTFLKKIIDHILHDKEITIPENCIISPVSANQLCSFIEFAVAKNLNGIYNCSCVDFISVFDFAAHFIDYYNSINKIKLNPEIKKIDSKQYLFPVDIPQFNKLSVEKAKKSGFNPEVDIFNSMEDYIKSGNA